MKQKSLKVNALLNVIKQCLSVVFPLITYPYVSRVLGADNLGRYSFSDSIVQIMITASLVGIPTYAVREGAMIRKESKKISEFCAEVFTINIISVLLTYSILFGLIFFVERIQIETVYISILSVNIMSRCLGRDWLNSLYEEYLYISLRFIFVHLVSLVMIFLFVKTENDLLVYVVIMMSSELFGNLLNILFTRKKMSFKLRFSKKLLRHLKPILILFCSSIATTIYIRSDITILGFLRPDDDVGIYSMASRVYTIVKSIINAIIAVAIPRLSFYLSESTPMKKKYNDLLNNLRNIIVLLVLPAAAGLFCLSNDIMFILGGEEFQRGELALKILCIAMLFAVFSCFFSYAVLIVNRQEKVFFKATICSAIINISLNFIFVPIAGIDGAAVTTVLSEVFVVFYCGFYAKKFFESDKVFLFSNFSVSIIESIIIFILSTIVNALVHNIVFRLSWIISLSLISYFLILLISKNTILYNLISKLKNKMKKDS